MNKNFIFLCLGLCFSMLGMSQDETGQQQEADTVKTNMKTKGIVFEEVEKKRSINPLAPSKAAFYSAVFPGLGQIYNRRYWKVPIVYAAIGTGIYAYVYNDDLYDRFRTAFKRRRAGFIDDEFYGDIPGSPILDEQDLQSSQERYQRDRDLALLITIGLYALNIIDANVDSHLKQFNVDEDLSIKIQPYLEYHPISSDPNYGVAITLKF